MDAKLDHSYAVLTRMQHLDYRHSLLENKIHQIQKDPSQASPDNKQSLSFDLQSLRALKSLRVKMYRYRCTSNPAHSIALNRQSPGANPKKFHQCHPFYFQKSPYKTLLDFALTLP